MICELGMAELLGKGCGMDVCAGAPQPMCVFQIKLSYILRKCLIKHSIIFKQPTNCEYELFR